jgi:hypothetical protein
MSVNKIKSNWVKFFPIDIFDKFKEFVYFRNHKMTDEVFNALVHTTYDIHSQKTAIIYAITNDEKKFVIDFAEELRKLNDLYYKQDTINIKENLLKQIKIPYQFYAEEDYVYFKTHDNKIYMSELCIDYFEIYDVDTSDWDDCPKISKGVLDYEDFLYENRGASDKWNYYKIINDNGFYCTLYRILTDKNTFKYKFDFVEYRDGKLYTKDKTNKFNIELNHLNVMYWYKKKF